MSGVAKKLMGTTAAGGGFTAIEEVFSSYLYTGNGSTQTITNGIDLAGEGGLVWIKGRNAATNHALVDTERGGANSLASDTTDAQRTDGAYGLTFNSDGFDSTGGNLNVSGRDQASWTFRKAPRFFDVVTYTGTGANQTIAHNLGTTVGTIITKRVDAGSVWGVYHRSLGATQKITLNETTAAETFADYWNNTEPTDTEFTVGTNASVNTSGGTYVAYLFAHDPLGPSGDGSDGLIACGSYTGNGLDDGPTISLGWEPQWLLVKRASGGTAEWALIDNMRRFTADGSDAILKANAADAEGNQLWVSPNATGFKLRATSSAVNASGDTYIYIAIRRGPMRAPESGTEVFDVQFNGGNDPSRAPVYQSGFVTDMAIVGLRTGGSVNYPYTGNRLMGIQTLETHTTDAEESGGTSFEWDFMDGFIDSVPSVITDTQIAWMFRRAPEFFDVVAYTGNDTTQTVTHNLGVAPELIIVKSRSTTGFWRTLSTSLSQYTNLNTTGAFTGAFVQTVFGDNTVYVAPTETQFTLGSDDSVNNVGVTYIAYLFATLAGISKVGSYTGNGTSQTIDCGFTSSARFLIIKRTDSTGDWYVWDTARGIVAANDPHLSLNTTAAEVTTDDSVDPDSSGFIVNQVAATNINVSAASYIFYAVS